MSSFEKESKKNLYFLKGIARVIARIFIEAVHRLLINVFDTLFGFLNWPQKKLRIKVLILPALEGHAVASPAELDAAIEYTKKSFSKHFNVKLLPHQQGSFVEVLQTSPPVEALYTKAGTGALAEELKITGSFFASNLSGFFYPVTVFVVTDIKGASGCSLGPLSDYVTLNSFGATRTSVLAHELAHACGLWHLKEPSNLLFPGSGRGGDITWWQKNIFRGSRHVTYW